MNDSVFKFRKYIFATFILTRVDIFLSTLQRIYQAMNVFAIVLSNLSILLY